MWFGDVCRTGNNGLWCVDVYRTGRVLVVQTRNNGTGKVRAMRWKGLDSTKVLIKIRKRRRKKE